jgi:hypothetical protein
VSATSDLDVLCCEVFLFVGDGDGALLSWLEVEIVVGEAGCLVGDFEMDEVGVCRRLETYS